MFVHLTENTQISPFANKQVVAPTMRNHVSTERSSSSTLWWVFGIVFSVLIIAALYLRRKWQNEVDTEILIIEEQETAEVEIFE